MEEHSIAPSIERDMMFRMLWVASIKVVYESGRELRTGVS
jgi:hypothetical protein